uniref:Uncharacterized protein n=1 Tax=Oryza nivara TaxID=4536 RepID=A0A0E0HQT7_ORYNI
MELMWGLNNLKEHLVPDGKSELSKEDCLPMCEGMKFTLNKYGFGDLKPEMVTRSIIEATGLLYETDYHVRKHGESMRYAGKHLKETSGINAEDWDLLKLATAIMMLCYPNGEYKLVGNLSERFRHCRSFQSSHRICNRRSIRLEKKNMSRHHPHLPVRTVASCSGSKLSNGNRSAGTPLHRLLGSYFYQMQMEKNELLSSPYECAVLQEACVAQMQPSTECPQQALLNCFAWPSIRLLPAHVACLHQTFDSRWCSKSAMVHLYYLQSDSTELVGIWTPDITLISPCSSAKQEKSALFGDDYSKLVDDAPKYKGIFRKLSCLRAYAEMVKSRRIRSKAARRLDSLVTAAERIYDEAQQAQPGVIKQDVPAAGLHLRALVFDADIKSVW